MKSKGQVLLLFLDDTWTTLSKGLFQSCFVKGTGSLYLYRYTTWVLVIPWYVLEGWMQKSSICSFIQQHLERIHSYPLSRVQ